MSGSNFEGSGPLPQDRQRRKIVTTDELLDDIEARVRPTIGLTYGRGGITTEGRISADDFDALVRMVRGLQDAYALAMMPCAGRA